MTVSAMGGERTRSKMAREVSPNKPLNPTPVSNAALRGEVRDGAGYRRR